MKVPVTIEQLLAPVVEGLGYEYVGIEMLRQGRDPLLRLYIDTENGISVEDCEKVSHQVSGVLEVEDPIKGHYVLEVSSPGMARPLFRKAQYEQVIGTNIKLELYDLLEGRRKWTGSVLAVTDEGVQLETELGAFEFRFSEIKKANVIPDYQIN